MRLDATKLHPLVLQTTAFVSAELKVRYRFPFTLPAFMSLI